VSITRSDVGIGAYRFGCGLVGGLRHGRQREG
jgi:hypothetical protein